MSERTLKCLTAYAVPSELVQTLVDIARRRTTIAMQGNYGIDLLPVMTATLNKYCGWSQERCARACQEYRTYYGRKLRSRLPINTQLVLQI